MDLEDEDWHGDENCRTPEQASGDESSDEEKEAKKAREEEATMPELEWVVADVPASIDVSVSNIEDETLFPRMKLELLAIIKNIDTHILRHTTFDGRIEHFFGPQSPWMTRLKTHVRMGLSRMGKETLGEHEVYEFLEFSFMCHFFNMSPTVLTHPLVQIEKPLMSLKRFEDILHSLDAVGSTERSHLFDSLRNASSMCQTISYVENGVLSLDDNKIRHRSTEVSPYRLARVFHRNGSPGPTVHLISSVLTAMPLVMHAQMEGETNAMCMTALFTTLCAEPSLLNARLPNVLFTLDKAYPICLAAYLFSWRGAMVFGSQMKPRGEKGNAFKSISMPKKESSLSAYWAVAAIPNGSLYELAFRSSNRISLLLCNEPVLSGNRWSMIVRHPQPKRLVINCTEQCEDETVIDMGRNELTINQGGREWFQLRKFKITGSVAAGAVAHLAHNWNKLLLEYPLLTEDNADQLDKVLHFLDWSNAARDPIENPQLSPVNYTDDEIRNLTRTKVQRIAEDEGFVVPASLKKSDLATAYISKTLKKRVVKSPFAHLLALWYVRPHHTAIMKRGITNELEMLPKLAEFFKAHCNYLSVERVFTVGMLEATDAAWMATSLDGVVEIRPLLEDNVRIQFPLEIKTRVVPNTVSQLMHLVSEYGRFKEITVTLYKQATACLARQQSGWLLATTLIRTSTTHTL
jgi:hypothetical protein